MGYEILLISRRTLEQWKGYIRHDAFRLIWDPLEMLFPQREQELEVIKENNG